MREIEQAINEKIKASFKKRDSRQAPQKAADEPTLFVFHIQEDGGVDFIGDVLEEREEVFRTEVLDAFMATGCGVWFPSGEIHDLKKSECRLYNDRGTCLRRALEINNALYRKQEREFHRK